MAKGRQAKKKRQKLRQQAEPNPYREAEGADGNSSPVSPAAATERADSPPAPTPPESREGESPYMADEEEVRAAGLGIDLPYESVAPGEAEYSDGQTFFQKFPHLLTGEPEAEDAVPGE